MKHFLFLNPVNVFYAEVCTGLLQVMSFKGLFIVLLSAWLSASGREGEEFSVGFLESREFFRLQGFRNRSLRCGIYSGRGEAVDGWPVLEEVQCCGKDIHVAGRKGRRDAGSGGCG